MGIFRVLKFDPSPTRVEFWGGEGGEDIQGGGQHLSPFPYGGPKLPRLFEEGTWAGDRTRQGLQRRGSLCHMLIIRNGNVSLLDLRKPHAPCQFQESAMSLSL